MPALADEWSPVNAAGFGEYNPTVSSMAILNSQLYAGTYNDAGCQVWRLSGDGSWEKVSGNGFGNANNKMVKSISVYDGALYAGTDNWTDGCQVYRYGGGTAWTLVSGNGFDAGNANVRASCMTVNASGLYAGTQNQASGARVYHYDGGTAWSQVNLNGFSDPDNWETTSLSTFNGNLYAGTRNEVDDGDRGCQVLRYDGGTAWTNLIAGGFGDLDLTEAPSMTVFGTRLYVGTGGGAGKCLVWGCDGAGTWAKASPDGFGSVANIRVSSLSVVGTNIWAGIANNSGCHVWRSDGSTWTAATMDGFGSSANNDATSIAAIESNLYVGTANANGCRVYLNTSFSLPTPTLNGPGASRDGSAVLWGEAGAPGATLSVSEGADVVVVTTVNEYGNYTVTATGLPEGSHSLYAVTSRAGLNSEPSAAYTLLVSHDAVVLKSVRILAGGHWYTQDERGIVNLNIFGTQQIRIEATFEGNVDSTGNALQVGSGMMGVDAIIEILHSSAQALQAIQGVTAMTPATTTSPLGTSVYNATVVTGVQGNPPQWPITLGVKVSDISGAETPCGVITESKPETDLSDPSGVVYDTVTKRRVQGARVSVERKEAGGNFSSWPAKEFGQANPQYTDFMGWYGWDVPDGDYRVVVEKDNYRTETSRTVIVPPEVTDLHVGIERDGPCEFFFAEGCTRPGFEEWITLQNPGEAPANATITYMLGTGENKEQKVTVPPRSRCTLSVNDFVGPDQDVSARVTSDELVIAERPMYFLYRDRWSGGHDVVGAESPLEDWYFAEGCTRPGFEEWLCLQNPGDNEAQVEITYMLGTGENKTSRHTVPARSRVTVDVNSEVGPDQDVSASVQSTNGVPIIAERPMYFMYRDKWKGGHDVVGAPTSRSWWYFAEGCTRPGFEEWLCLQNTGGVSANVTITYMLGTGENRTQQISVGPMSRATVDVNAFLGEGQDVSCTVVSDSPVIAERPMYFNYHDSWAGGHDVVGAMYTKDVYFFAEGCTLPGFEEWLCLQNPNDTEVAVELTYMLGTGENKMQNMTVPPKSRSTVNVVEAVGVGQDVSVKVTSTGGNIICERPVYFNYHDKWTGGHDVVGY